MTFTLGILTCVFHAYFRVGVCSVLANAAERAHESPHAASAVHGEENAASVVVLLADLALHCGEVKQVACPPSAYAPRAVTPVRIHVLTKDELWSSSLLDPYGHRLSCEYTMETGEVQTE